MMRIRCDAIYTEKGKQSGVLCIDDDGIICDIRPFDTPFDLDARGLRMLPGIIDIHTHGFRTYASQSTQLSNYRKLSLAMASQGVTGFLVTAGEHNAQELQELQTIASAIEHEPSGARILGIHMEGPFLNPKRKGAFMEEQLLPLSIAWMQTYQKAANGHIRYVSYAPELDEDHRFLHYLQENGIRSAGGHTTATAACYADAIRHGLCASTHTGNGMRQIDRREVGALGAALLAKDLYNEIICDLIHLSKEMLQIILRVKDPSRLLMISDSGQLSGLPCGTYRIHHQNRILLEDGRIVLEDGSIAGSSKSILWGIRCMEEQLHVPMETLVRMSAGNQAQFLGMDDHIGSIAPGKDADLVLIDPAYAVVKTFVKGKCVYDRQDSTLPLCFDHIERL